MIAKHWHQNCQKLCNLGFQVMFDRYNIHLLNNELLNSSFVDSIIGAVSNFPATGPEFDPLSSAEI